MQRILVLRGGALGDLLVTLPALHALRRRWPQAHFALVGNTTAAQLAAQAGLLDRVFFQHAAPWHTLYARELAPELRDQLAGYDLVFNFWPDPDGGLAAHFPLRARQTFLGASAQPACAPASRHFCQALQPLGLRCASPIFALRQAAPAPNLVALHAGSGSPRKNWPAARWRELAGWLRTTLHADLAIIRGEAEPTGLLDGCGQPWDRLPLPELADRLARCALFIGHDSGISHLAAACGCRGVLLFGPTNPAVWAPPTPRLTVLREGADLSSLSLERVRRAVTAALSDQR